MYKYGNIDDNMKQWKNSHTNQKKKTLENALKLETIRAHIPRYIIALKFVDTKVQIQVSEE